MWQQQKPQKRQTVRCVLNILRFAAANSFVVVVDNFGIIQIAILHTLCVLVSTNNEALVISNVTQARNLLLRVFMHQIEKRN